MSKKKHKQKVPMVGKVTYPTRRLAAAAFQHSLVVNATGAERHVKRLLEQLGVSFTFQKPWEHTGLMEFYISDFYFPLSKVTLELDGPQHQRSKLLREKDGRKASHLSLQRVQTVRLTNPRALALSRTSLEALLRLHKII